jgi:hypothetical protein
MSFSNIFASLVSLLDIRSLASVEPLSGWR